MSNLLKPFNCIKLINRTAMNKTKRFNWNNEGIQYPGFKYYPMDPNFKDPPYEPTKLFRVQRIKPLKGVPYNEKKILQEFHLDGKQSDVIIVKNIPENNHRLWKVKHLIEIKPITFPNGFPKDIHGTYLKENGELVVSQNLGDQEKKLQLTSNEKTKPERLDGDTLRRESRYRWLNGWQ